VLPYDTASLMLRTQGDMLSIIATRGFDSTMREGVEQLTISLQDDKTMAEIVETRKPIVVADAQANEYFIPVEGTEHIRGWIGAPLLIEDEVIGLLTVDSSQIAAYDEDDAQRLCPGKPRRAGNSQWSPIRRGTPASRRS
jgi:signal transduction protein with GAF and PtsI domain